MDTKALSILMRHPFSGNVRELLNIVEHAFVLCPGGVLLVEHLPAHLRAEESSTPTKSTQTVDDFEAELIRAALSRHGFNRAKTAEELGMHTTTLWRKMKKLGIPPDGSR